MVKLTKKKIVDTSPSNIGKMKNAELRQFLRAARQLFNTQQKTFKKYEKTVYSPALDKMEDYYDSNGKKSVSRMTTSQLRNEIFRLQEFFDSESSTVPGARKIATEQDRRIFGVDEKGNPVRRMTLQQRSDFWAAYQEFVSMQKESYIRNMGSNTIQQYLGEMIIESSKKSGNSEFINYSNFEELKRRIEKQKAQEDWEMVEDYGDSDIFSGKRIIR